MIDKAADDEMGQQCAACHHLGERQIDCGRLADLFATSAYQPGPDMADDAKACRDIIEHLGDGLVDLHCLAVTASAARTGLMIDSVAREVRGKRNATAGFAGRFRHRRRRQFIVGGFRCLDLLEHQPQLGDIHFLGAAAELDAQQPCDAMLELFDPQGLGFDGCFRCRQFGPFLLHDIGHLQQHFLQENRVCRKAIKGEPHARDDSRRPRQSLHKMAVLLIFLAMPTSA
jgi:hypothetical protein